MEFWSRLDDVRDRWDVLRHCFYERWSRGELSREELALYSGQYRHAVVALADASDAAASGAGAALRAQLAEHAAEERGHVALWDGFLDAVGGDAGAEPTPETGGCASAWAGAGERGLAGHLVALYAIEAAQPAISATKREGLVRFYGVDAPDALAYFDVHAELDHVHAEQDRRALEALLDGADPDALIVEAERVLRANWQLLDGVQARRPG